jgi:hypothetical protein
MAFSPDLTIAQVDPPFNRWCCSGHIPPETFNSDGPDRPATPTKFFSVESADISGKYCEICLIVANYVAQCKKGKSK